MCRVEFFKIGKRDNTFIREMRVHTDKSKVEISQNFVAFTEYTNFTVIFFFRLREGQGEAIYEIGVEDNGLMTGLSDVDMDSSIETLREMARRLEATIQVSDQI